MEYMYDYDPEIGDTFFLLEDGEVMSEMNGYYDYPIYHISHIFTNKDYRGKRYATKLLQLFMNDVNRRYKLKYVELDDVIEGEKNIWEKLGFLLKDKSDNWVKWTRDSIKYGPERRIDKDVLLQKLNTSCLN